MIAPTYRRDHLWGPARRGVRIAILAGGCAGVTFALLVALSGPRRFVFIDDSPRSEAQLLVTKLVRESFPAWREHHAPCPRRLGELLAGAYVDPWGHAMHYTCDPRLAQGGHFAVVSAGEDGVFGTSDDIEDHE